MSQSIEVKIDWNESNYALEYPLFMIINFHVGLDIFGLTRLDTSKISCIMIDPVRNTNFILDYQNIRPLFNPVWKFLTKNKEIFMHNLNYSLIN